MTGTTGGTIDASGTDSTACALAHPSDSAPAAVPPDVIARLRSVRATHAAALEL